jgi:hypothetical protein
MSFIDALLMFGLVAICSILAFAAWTAVSRVYHWRRDLERVEQFAWRRVLARLDADPHRY